MLHSVVVVVVVVEAAAAAAVLVVNTILSTRDKITKSNHKTWNKKQTAMTYKFQTCLEYCASSEGQHLLISLCLILFLSNAYSSCRIEVVCVFV